MVIGSPRSIAMAWSSVKCDWKSNLPLPRSSSTVGTVVFTYRTSVNPSARSKASQIYCGAKQMTGALPNRTVVVSSAGSSAHPHRGERRPAAPASDRVVKKPRRVCVFDIGILPLLYGHAFSSRLSSSRKRQSVPSAMIFCGLDLTKPNSCSRSA
jgi:hypothetical protein